MKGVDLYGRVRYAVRIEGLSERAAARRFGIDPRTVHKMMMFPVPPGYRRTKPPARPKLDPFIVHIDRILEEDRPLPKKQRHTSKRIFEVGFEKLADRPFTRFTSMIAQVPALLRLRSYRTVAGLVNSHIKHPLLRQAFSIHPLLVGGNPFTTTSIYALIHYLERRWGVFFCMGGTGRLVEQLHRLLERTGVRVELGVDIESITTSGGLASGATAIDGRHFPADRVI